MQRKIHNQTLFVTALSVYFGLLIVGAPPHVLAQQLKAQAKQDGFAVKLNRKPFDDFARQFKQQIDNGIIDLENTCSVSVKATLEKDGKLINARVINKTGDFVLCQAGVDFISALGDSRTLTYFSNFGESPTEITLTLVAQNGNFNLTSAITLENEQRAQTVVSGLNLVLSIAQQQEKSQAKQDLLRQIKVSQKGNDLLIVTHLPRAALDALLKADEKAN